jgi:hypothetical protein
MPSAQFNYGRMLRYNEVQLKTAFRPLSKMLNRMLRKTKVVLSMDAQETKASIRAALEIRRKCWCRMRSVHNSASWKVYRMNQIFEAQDRRASMYADGYRSVCTATEYQQATVYIQWYKDNIQDAENDLANAKVDYYNSKYDYNSMYTYYQQQKIMSFTLQIEAPEAKLNAPSAPPMDTN